MHLFKSKEISGTMTLRYRNSTYLRSDFGAHGLKLRLMGEKGIR